MCVSVFPAVRPDDRFIFPLHGLPRGVVRGFGFLGVRPLLVFGQGVSEVQSAPQGGALEGGRVFFFDGGNSSRLLH